MGHGSLQRMYCHQPVTTVCHGCISQLRCYDSPVGHGSLQRMGAEGKLPSRWLQPPWTSIISGRGWLSP